MDFHRLYRLVHSLSTEEKRKFSRFTRSKRDTLVVLLYERILRLECLDKASIKVMQGTEFKRASTFIIYREKLADLILKSLARTAKGFISFDRYIVLAFLNNADEIAKKMLFQELDRLQKNEDFPGLVRLHSLISGLHIDYQIEIKLPQNTHSREYIFSQNKTRIDLEAIIEKLRDLKGASVEHRAIVADEQLEVLSSICGQKDSMPKTCWYLRLKILMNLSYLKEDYESANAFGKQLIEFIDSSAFQFSSLMVSKDLSFIAMNAVRLGNRDWAVDLLFRLSALNMSTIKEKKINDAQRIRIGTVIAIQFTSFEIALKIYTELRQKNCFPDCLDVVTKYYSCAITFFLNHEFRKAIDCISFLMKHAPKNISTFRWESSMLAAIAYFEIGDIDNTEFHLSTAIAEAKEQKSQYARLATKFFQGYLSVPTSSQEFSLKNAFSRLIRLQGEISEPQKFFHVEIWIESKLQLESMKIIREKYLASNTFQHFLANLS